VINRAVLLIGVSRTGGGLVPLQAVETGLDDMQSWALGQGIAPASIGRFSDANGGQVRMRDLQDWVKQQNDDLQVPEQLTIYFSGHGFHGAMGEFWLLSDAPANPIEAVSLASTEALARNCSFGHVILISDACRVPSNNIQFGYVTGGSLFPNEPPAGQSKPVDQFFAASLGQPALEVDDKGKVFSIYTSQLKRSLSGLETPLLEPQDKTGPTPVVVRAWPLKRYLPGAISQRLRALNIQQAMVPDAIITSEPEMWLATFPNPPAPSFVPSIPRQASDDAPSDEAGKSRDGIGELPRTRAIQPSSSFGSGPNHLEMNSVPPPSTPSELFHMDLALALKPSSYEKQQDVLTVQRDIQASVSQSYRSATSVRSIDRVPNRTEPVQFGWHFETECGFVIAGGTVIDAHSSPTVMVDRPSPVEVRVSPREKLPELALLKFDGGMGLLVPAIPGQIGYITIEPNGALTSLGYEPSSQRQEWLIFKDKSNAIRSLRTFLNTTAAAGNLRFAVLDDAQLDDIQQTMRYGPAEVDLSLLILVGYISYKSRRVDLLNQLRDFAVRQFAFLPMDLAILSLLSDPSFRLDAQPVLPPFPLLTQGWPLMDASSMHLPEPLSGLRSHVLPAAWTSVDAEGYGLLEHYLAEENQQSAELAASQ
jgi:hypothetical protein